MLEQIKKFISSQLCNSWKQGRLSFTQICAKLSHFSFQCFKVAFFHENLSKIILKISIDFNLLKIKSLENLRPLILLYSAGFFDL